MSEGLLYRLSIHADPIADGLARILNVVAVQPIDLTSVRHDQLKRGATTVLMIAAPSAGKADLLAARLGQVPWIRSVQLLPVSTAARRLPSDHTARV
jgi:hypothetical protein